MTGSGTENQESVVIPLSQLPAGALRQVHIHGERVCVAHTGEGIYAVSDTCTHARVPLSDGYLEGRQVVCPWHGAMFDLKTGQPTCGPATYPLRRYHTRLSGDDVIVESLAEEQA